MNHRTDTAPEMGRIPEASARFGVSRSALYRLAPQHPGLFVKMGAATLVNFAMLRAILANLPAANIRPARAAEAASASRAA